MHLAYPLYYQAEKLLYQSLYDNAIERYKETIEKKDNWDSAHSELGWVYYRKGQFNLALSECKRALELSPNNRGALNGIAAVYLSDGEYSLAEAYFLRIEKINPRNGPYSNLAIVYDRQGKYNKALDILEKSFKIHPNDAHRHFIKGNILLHGKRKYSEAIQSYELAEKYELREDIQKQLLYHNLALAYYKRYLKGGTLPEDIKEHCMSYLTKALDKIPDDKDSKKLYKKISKARTRKATK